eukprot:gene12964-8820_t
MSGNRTERKAAASQKIKNNNYNYNNKEGIPSSGPFIPHKTFWAVERMFHVHMCTPVGACVYPPPEAENAAEGSPSAN